MKKMMVLLILALVLLFAPLCFPGEESPHTLKHPVQERKEEGQSLFERRRHNERNYLVFTAPASAIDLRFYWQDPSGEPFRRFLRLQQFLESTEGHTPLFLMNGGIYDTDLSPLGLYIEEGELFHPVNRATSGGNFALLPNGIFFVREDGTPGILETETFLASGIQPRFAIQSGPLLLQQGQVHPAFLPDSESRYTRNAVGMAGEEIIFLLSLEPVTFWECTRALQDLGVTDALYLDGSVSAFYRPEEQYGPWWMKEYGTFIGVFPRDLK